MGNQSDALSGQYRLTELHLVHTIINHHLQVVHFNNLVPQIWQHGQGEIPMCNSALKRAFHFGAFRIDVYPLMVQCRISKQIDTLLRELYIFRNTDLLAYQLSKSSYELIITFSITLYFIDKL